MNSRATVSISAPPHAAAIPVERPPTPHERFLATRSFGSLDGLRAFSIIAVVWHHTSPPLAAWIGTARGFLGVDLFFSISGFLIVTLILRERRRSGAISLRNFYARRFLRIFPLYYAFLLGMLVISLILTGGHSLRVRQEIVWCFVYLTNWVDQSTFLAITWSLSAEEQFYLVWPPIERFLGGRATIALGVLIAASLALQLSRVYLGVMPGLPPMLWQTTFLPILLGVALAHVMDTACGFALVHRLAGWRGASVVFLGILLLALSYPGHDISGFPRIGIHLSFVAFLASCVVREDHALAGGLRLPVLARIGVVSYGMYILHQPCRHLAALIVNHLGYGGDGFPLFAITLLLTVAVAEISYRYFETPMLRLKRRFETVR